MTGCSALHCSNQSCKKRMFRFPRNSERRKIWEISCKRGEWRATENSRLCQDHFDVSQFEPATKRLRRDAIPTRLASEHCLVNTTYTQKSTLGQISNTSKQKDTEYVNDHTYYKKLSINEEYIEDLEKTDMSVVQSHSCSFVENRTNLIPLDIPSADYDKNTEDVLSTLVEIDKSEETQSISLENEVQNGEGHTSLDNNPIEDLRLQLANAKRKIWNLQKQLCLERKRRNNLTKSLSFLKPDQIAVMTKKKQAKWSRDTLRYAFQICFACGIEGYKTLLQNNFPLPSYRTLCRVKYEPGILPDSEVTSS